MKQRSRDTEIWKDPWYRKLPVLYKCFWDYLCDNADHSGVWKVDLELAEFQIGEKIDEATAFRLFNADKERVNCFKAGYWLLVEFIPFHYGSLLEGHPFHKKVLSLVQQHGIEALLKASQRLKDKRKEETKTETKEKEKEGDCEGGKSRAEFELFWSAYPARRGKKVGKQDALREFQRLKLQEPDIQKLMKAVRHYAASDEYPKDASRFLKNDYWRDWIEPPVAEARRPYLTKAQEHNLESLRRLNENANRDIQPGGAIDLHRLPGPEVRG